MNPTTPSPGSSPNRTIIILMAVAATIVVLVIVAIFAASGKPKTPALSPGSSYDANSGQTVSNPDGKVPEIRSGAADQPIYLGFGTLYDRGLTTYQLDDTKLAFATYSSSASPKVTQVSVVVNSIVHNLPTDTENESLTFNVVLNDKTTFAASVSMISLTAIDLTLTDPKTHKQVFDSGTVDLPASD